MAVRKKVKRKREIPSFSGVAVPKSKLLLIVKMLIIAVFIVVFVQLSKTWKTLWPVKSVVVENELHYMTPEILRAFVKQQNISGLLALNLNELQQSVKEIDWVKSVEIKKVWPEQLAFTIQEHFPVAQLNQSVLTQQGNLIAVDLNDDRYSHLPEFDFEQAEEMKQSDYLTIWKGFKLIKREFELLSLTPTKLAIDRLDNWLINFDNELQINLGRKNHKERIARLINAYASIQNKQELKKVDLRYHNGLAIQWQEQPEQKLVANLFSEKES